MRIRIALSASLVFGGCASVPSATLRSDAVPLAEDTVLLAEETTGTTVLTSGAGRYELSHSHWGLMGLRSITPDSAEAWYEELDISLASPQGYEVAPTEGALYRPFVLALDETGQAETLATPEFHPELLELSDLTRQFHDFFPPRPPGPLTPGSTWTDTLRVDQRSEKGSRFRLTRIGRYEVEGRVQVPGLRGGPDTASLTLVMVNETASYEVETSSPDRERPGVITVTHLEGRYDGWYSLPAEGGFFVQRERDFLLTGTLKEQGGDQPVRLTVEQRHQSRSGRFTREEWNTAMADSAEYVFMEFDWPTGTVASVEARERYSRMYAEERQEFVIETDYTMGVERHREGLLVRHGDVAVRTVEADPPLSEGSGLIRVAAGMAQHRPNLVVSPSGLLLRVEGLSEAMAAVRAGAKDWLDSLSAAGTELPRVIQYLFSDEFLLDQYTDRWDALIGLWASMESGVGQSDRIQVEMPSPLGPAVLIPVTVELSLPGRMPCTETDLPDSCVELVYTAIGDREGTLEMFETVWDQVIEGVTGRRPSEDAPFALELADFAYEQRVRVVARPESLLPYRFDYSKIVRLLLSIDGAPTEFEQISELAHTFSYDDPR